jgi:hypothetical protein
MEVWHHTLLTAPDDLTSHQRCSDTALNCYCSSISDSVKATTYSLASAVKRRTRWADCSDSGGDGSRSKLLTPLSESAAGMLLTQKKV